MGPKSKCSRKYFLDSIIQFQQKSTFIFTFWKYPLKLQGNKNQNGFDPIVQDDLQFTV